MEPLQSKELAVKRLKQKKKHSEFAANWTCSKVAKTSRWQKAAQLLRKQMIPRLLLFQFNGAGSVFTPERSAWFFVFIYLFFAAENLISKIVEETSDMGGEHAQPVTSLTQESTYPMFNIDRI